MNRQYEVDREKLQKMRLLMVRVCCSCRDVVWSRSRSSMNQSLIRLKHQVSTVLLIGGMESLYLTPDL